MKKWIATSCFTLLAVLLNLPLLVFVLSRIGLIAQLLHIDLFTGIVAVLAILSSIFAKAVTQSKGFTTAFAFSAPQSVVFAGFCIYRNQSLSVVICVTVCVICCWYLAIRYCKSIPQRVTSLCMGAVLLVPVGIVIFFSLCFGKFGAVRVIQTVASPSQTMCAQVVENDDGALGGATLVQVRKNWHINLCILQISPKPKTVYYGEWYEHKNMRVVWKSDQCLTINGVDMYSISGF